MEQFTFGSLEHLDKVEYTGVYHLVQIRESLKKIIILISINLFLTICLIWKIILRS